MVKQNLNHTMFFVLGVLAIATVLKYHLNETVWSQSKQQIAQKRLHYTAAITKAEVENFIRLWPQFYKIGMGKDFSVSSQIEHPETMIKWHSYIWFIYHQTDPERFFYVQQHIDYLLNAVEVRRNAKALIERLERQPESANKAVTKEMIEYQKMRYEAEKISPEEQELMDVYEEQLRNLRKEYPFANLSSPEHA